MFFQKKIFNFNPNFNLIIYSCILFIILNITFINSKSTSSFNLITKNFFFFFFINFLNFIFFFGKY